MEDTRPDNYPIVEFCLQGNYEIIASISGGDGDIGIQVFSSDEMNQAVMKNQ